MAKPQQKSAPIDTRNLTVDQRRELFLKGRKEEKPDYQVLTKDYTDELIPYGLITFDYVLGLGGISRHGRVSQVHGDEGVGKSTLTYQIAKNYQEYTGEPLGVFDFEGTGTPEYLARIGCDMDMVTLRQPDSMENAVIDTIDLIKQGCRFFIYDSIPWINTMVDEKDIRSKKAFRASYGKHAQIMDKFFKTLHPYVKRADGHMFMINQTRSRIDDSTEASWANDYSYTNKTYVLPGGRICRFTPSTMIELRMIKEVKPFDGKPGSAGDPAKDCFVVEPATPETEGKPCVNLVRARTLKNKVTGAGFREGHIWVRPATSAMPGIDDLMSVRELAREYGYITNKGAKWCVGRSFDDAIIVYPNKDAAVEDLTVNRNPEVHAKLKALLAEAIVKDQSGRHATVVTAEEIGMIEGDDVQAPVGKGLVAEEDDE
jgi:RecA/RadA recombinase